MKPLSGVTPTPGGLGLDERSEVVDLGAGTGQFALSVAAVRARVVAVDVSPLMLARLRAKLAAHAALIASAVVEGAGGAS